MFNVETREVRPVPCSRLACWVCAGYLAWKRSLAMAWARPQRRFELTLVGDDFQTARARVKRFRHAVVSNGYAWEHSWMIEPNPAGTGHHLHGYQHGDFVPQATLSDIADGEGMGMRVYIKALAGSKATGYGLKALTYGLKGITRGESHRLHLDANGDRLSHHSRGFYGVPVREAERLALAEHREGGASSWVIATVAELDRAFAREPS
jgi:hypothetical protein